MSRNTLDRREFLNRLGLSAVVLTAGALSCAKEEKKVEAGGGPKVGMCTIAFQDRPLDEALKLAAEAGFEGVELWGKPEHVPLTRTDDEVKAVREKIESLGLVAGVYGCYVRLGDGQDPAEKDKDMERALRITKLLGTRLARIWAGTKNSELLTEEDWRLMVADGKRFCARAEDAGIILAVEMHSNSVTNKARAAMELIERVGSPNLKLNYQPIEMEDHYERARIVAAHTVNVHAQNFDVDGKRTLISKGVVDYRMIYEILKEAGFEGYFEVEFVKGETMEEKIAALKADCEFLKSIGKPKA